MVTHTKIMTHPKLVTRAKTVHQIDHEATGKLATRYRELYEVSQAAVARKLGIGASFMCLIEGGKRNWNADLLRAYCNAVDSLTEKK
mgnify:CR=1 FL=1